MDIKLDANQDNQKPKLSCSILNMLGHFLSQQSHSHNHTIDFKSLLKDTKSTQSPNLIRDIRDFLAS